MKKLFNVLWILILFIIVCISGTWCNSEVSVALVTDIPDEQEIKKIINLYFSLRYEAFQTDKILDFSSVIDDSDIKTTE